MINNAFSGYFFKNLTKLTLLLRFLLLLFLSQKGNKANIVYSRQ